MTTTTTAPQTRDALADQMEADSYVVGRPPHVDLDTISLDRQAAAETTCDECGNVGLDFLPFRSRDRLQIGGYRAMAYCYCCDAAFEL